MHLVLGHFILAIVLTIVCSLLDLQVQLLSFWLSFGLFLLVWFSLYIIAVVGQSTLKGKDQTIRKESVS